MVRQSGSSSAAASISDLNQTENIKDTIESLVVAFILAFVFRGFLVEAFVIPTGSMAPTLYGEHGTQVCPDCGWEYAFGMPRTNPDRKEIKCPNCGRQTADHIEVPYHGPGRSCELFADRMNPNIASEKPRRAEQLKHVSFLPQSGDRILVFKWPYDLGGEFLGPKPWDVVVFKNPAHQGDNYIKRLLGMPNEVLEIIDGDIYACQVSDLAPDILRKMERVLELKFNLRRSRHRQYSLLESLQQEVSQSITEKLRIRRKTAIAQKSLWQVVFHQDYLPPAEVPRRNRPHWEPVGLPAGQSCWDITLPQITFTGLESSPQSIRFAGKRIEDFYAYNFGTPVRDPSSDVSDLRLKFVLHYKGGDGKLSLSMSKQDDEFTAELGADGHILLKQTSLSKRRSTQFLASAQIEAWRKDQPIEIEFANVDYQLYVKINGVDQPVLSTTDDVYYPDIKKLRRRRGSKPSKVNIAADRLDIELWHLGLERDVYYKNSYRNESSGWGTTENPIYLREGEYFVLGDNSPASQDSRLWHKPGEYLDYRDMDYQVGTVPADQLIGRAFFVYWPSGYRVKWMPVLKNIGLIPNVGKMRWIR